MERAAVSTRRTMGPRVTGAMEEASRRSDSAGVKSPSGPIQTERAEGGGVRAAVSAIQRA